MMIGIDSMVLPPSINRLSERDTLFCFDLVDRLYSYTMMVAIKRMGNFSWEDADYIYFESIDTCRSAEMRLTHFDLLDGAVKCEQLICARLKKSSALAAEYVGIADKDLEAKFDEQFGMYFLYNRAQCMKWFRDAEPEKSRQILSRLVKECDIMERMTMEYYFRNIWIYLEDLKPMAPSSFHVTSLAIDEAFLSLKENISRIKNITEIEPYLQEVAKNAVEREDNLLSLN